MTAATPLLRLSNLRIEANVHPRARPRPPLLEGLSLDLAEGQVLAIVGESGSGKTMAARAVLDLLAPGVRRTGGSIQLSGRELTALSPDQMRAVRGGDIGMVFQEPMVSLNPAIPIGKQLAEGLRLHRKLPEAEIRRQCLEMLRRVQIADPEKCLAAYPHEFSGGMRQRIMLASVMLLKPRLLIADEPTTALDTLSQREVLELMVELARDYRVAVLLITHDLGLVAKYAEKVVVLEKGKLVEAGDTRQVLTAPEHPYTQRLVGSLPRRSDGRQALAPDAPVLLSVKGCCIDYAGKPGLLWAGPPKRVVHGVDVAVRAGEILAVVGASGSGKSTLGRAMLGLKPIAEGAVTFDGVDIARMRPEQMRAFRRDAQLVFQDPFSSLDPRWRVGQIIAAALRNVPGLDARQRHERVERILEEVGMGGFADRHPHQMSGGQRQRVAIARAVVSQPRLVIADEPVSALDMTIQLQVLDLFQALQAQYGFACVFITHDLAVVEQIADTVLVLSQGRVVEIGTVEAVFAAPQHAYTQALLAATPTLAAVALAG
jgi:peptide/nickel transport system ATP-binding protein